jgi:hypothetical protein
MEIGIFIPSGSQFDNEIPPPRQRKNSVFWSFLTPMLGLQVGHGRVVRCAAPECAVFGVWSPKGDAAAPELAGPVGAVKHRGR